MPYFPQYQNASLVEWANYRQISQTLGVTAITALPGDFIINQVTAGDATAFTITLPLVVLGGPVGVKMTGAAGNVSNTIVIIPVVADTVAGCKIDGFGSLKITQVPETLILASDGTNWWTVSKQHNTTSTW